jgi:hypothetical protein
VIIFCSVRFLLKKNNETEIFFLKKTETGSNRPVSVRFGSIVLGQKPVQTGLALFFWFGSVFFPDWVRFGFFGFRLVKLKPNRLVFSKF